MIRKSLISSLLFLFLLISTGFPVTIAYCSMAKSSSEDMMCPMCKNELKEYKSNILTKQNSQTELKPVCCLIKTIDFSIKDKFVSGKSEISNTFNFYYVSPAVILNNDIHGLEFVYSIKDKSPPGIYCSQLFLNNSVLLI